MKDVLKQEVVPGDLIITNVNCPYPQMGIMTGTTKGGKCKFISFCAPNKYGQELKQYNHYASKIIKVTEQQMREFAQEESNSFPLMRHLEKTDKLLEVKKQIEECQV